MIKQFVRTALLCGVAIGSSGCETIRDLEAQSRVDPQTIALYQLSGSPEQPCPIAPTGRYANTVSKKAGINDRGPGDNHTGAVPLRCFNFPDDTANAYAAAAMPQGSAYQRAVGSQKASEDARYARNRLASILMKQSDDICTVEMGRLISRDAMVNTTLSIGDSALSAASTAATGQLFKSILSGGAGLLNSSRESVNANVYRNVMSTTVAKAIRKERDKDRTDLIQHFGDNTIDYPVDRMVMEVNEYHQTCSFYHGLDLVVEAVSRDENSSDYVRLNGEIATLTAEIDDLDKRIEGSKDDKEKASLGKIRADKVTARATIEEARTKIILPAAAEKKTGDAAAGGKGD